MGALEGEIPHKRSENEVRPMKQQKQPKQQKKTTQAEQQIPPEPAEAEQEKIAVDEVASLREQLRQEQEKSKEHVNKLLYVQADFENYRKRLNQEVESRVDAGKARLIQNLLSIVDELELALRAARNTENASAVAEGLEIVLKKFRDLLAAEGLSKIEAVGKKFDPSLHEAVERIPCEGKEEGTILEEVREGYTMKGRLVRPSIVKIAVPHIAEHVNSEPGESGNS
jgi:molecular chaperone GrpE